MKFTQTVRLYKVNENNTVTVYVPSATAEDKNDYFQCKAKYKLLTQLEDLKQNTEILAEFGVFYEKGKGLALQLISYTVE